MSELALQLIAENKAKREQGEDATYLDLGNCGLTKLPAEIKELVWLETLILGSNWTEYDLQENEWVDQRGSYDGLENSLVSIDGIESLITLEKLVISGHARPGSLINFKFRDLSCIRSLVNLRELYCSDMRSIDFNLSPIQGLPNLQILNFSGTNIQDLSPIQGLPNLQILNLSGTNIQDLTPIQGLTNLQILNLFATNIQDLSPIRGLTNLQVLNFTGENIQDLSSIQNLINLQILDLDVKNLRDLSPIQKLINLQTLNLPTSNIEDLSPIQ